MARANKVACSARMDGVALDALGLLMFCHGQHLVGVELEFCGPGSYASEYARHSADPVSQRSPYRLSRPAAMQVGHLKWWTR